MDREKKTENIETSPEKLSALIRSYKGGDETAFDRLAYLYNPLVENMVNRCYEGLSSCYERDDIRQFALIALSKAALSYDEEQDEVTFGLYAKVCIGNALISKMRFVRKRHVEVLPIEGIFGMADLGDISEEIIDRENVGKLYELIKVTLSEFEGKVFKLYVSGCSSSEIADRLGKSDRSVQNAIFRARKKLKSVLNETQEWGSLIN